MHTLLGCWEEPPDVERDPRKEVCENVENTPLTCAPLARVARLSGLWLTGLLTGGLEPSYSNK